MKILHVIDSLAASGCARQLELLAPLLSRSDMQLEVCCLRTAGPKAATLRGAGIIVHELHWCRWFDAAAWWRLNELMRRLEPDVIHAWRRPALRAVALAAPDRLARVVVSSPLPQRSALPWYDRWLLRQVRCLAVTGPADQWQCRAAGLASTRVEIVPRAVSINAARTPAAAEPAARRIVCVGALQAGQGFRDAIWALDILNQLYPDLQLWIAGEGPQEEELRRFARILHKSHQVRFLGAVEDVAGLLRSAEICWIPSRANCGRQVALEALAEGCAVIAADVPCLHELIQDGENGLLTPPGDVVGLARRTRALFLDPALRMRLSRAARQEAKLRGDAAEAAQRWRALYGRLAA
jgi:glycosyltransferase involved in cell wall biosynthesis